MSYPYCPFVKKDISLSTHSKSVGDGMKTSLKAEMRDCTGLKLKECPVQIEIQKWYSKSPVETEGKSVWDLCHFNLKS
jgi:hypothetical protein